ncbi:thiaminase (transcriptional activator TenA) [Granulicatella balaenopterae]|uniref:Aminopyrimidine aminohydrolase n=1 Tax=Granulicatella balaenopterae TaxID=137733 RepID=A0A1H9HEV3_9LACT|nr:thiaminase II [Granulicatella balaenopterae]SEQ60879.1 thiaminase (transcriptional activator TenA) [Granulicatella balaenopterae]
MQHTDIIKEKAAPIVDLIYNDGFVQGLINGDLDKEAVAHYLRADSRYLKSFLDVYAILLAKTSHLDEKKYLLEQVLFLMDGEHDAHHNLAEYIGIPYEEIIADGEWYPAADHYIKHMLYNAYAKPFEYAIAASTPCPWVYFEIATRILKEHTITDDHPFKVWIDFYADDMVRDIMNSLDTIMNKYCDKASEKEQKELYKNFLESCEHERNFFNMAYTQQRWLVEL